jgi:hypothetical protein
MSSQMATRMLISSACFFDANQGSHDANVKQYIGAVPQDRLNLLLHGGFHAKRSAKSDEAGSR